jgi:hydrogenase maturation protease
MNMFAEISRLTAEKTCIVGMGNPMRGDDGVGVYIADGVKGAVRGGNIDVVNVEDVLENYVFDIARRDAQHVILVDAVHSGGEAGSVIFGRLEDLNEVVNDYSTHRLSIMLSGKIFGEHGKDTYLLGVEVEDIDFGAGITDMVRKSADQIRDLLIHYINCTQKEPVYEY